MSVKIINEKKFFEIIKSKKRVIVDLFAEWCNPCRKLIPVFKELAEKYPDFTFVKVDIDENEELGDHEIYGTTSIPCILFFENGKMIKKEVGFSGKKKFEKLFKKVYKL